MATLTVGAGEAFGTLSAAVGAASAGDTILVNAGTYVNDFVTVSVPLTIQSVGGMANFVDDGTVPIPNGKAIMTVDANLTINGLGFSGASVPDGNGAGIRYETGNLTIENSLFQGNQDGLLGAPNPTGTITIDHSEFTGNGAGDGYTHNIYVGAIQTLTIENSTITAANVGHDIKSRAANDVIIDNRITDGPDGSTSYEIDLPNAGNAVIAGNVIEKGPNAQNNHFISYGEEGVAYAGNGLSITGNVVIDDLAGIASTVVANIPDASLSYTLSDNTIYGVSADDLGDGTGTMVASGNVLLPLPGPPLDTSAPFAVPAPGGMGLFLLAAAVLRRVRAGRKAGRRPDVRREHDNRMAGLR